MTSTFLKQAELVVAKLKYAAYHLLNLTIFKLWNIISDKMTCYRGKKILKCSLVNCGQVHLNLYSSCCQIMLGIQGNISLHCIFLLVRQTLDENICLS